MQLETIKKTSFDIKFFSVIISVLLFLSLTVNLALFIKLNNNLSKMINKLTGAIVQPVNAAEIYPEFVCGCCGKPLDPDDICCGDMQQKIDYINGLVASNLSKDEIMMKTTKKFGFNSLAKEEIKVEIKNKLIAKAPVNAPQIVFEQKQADLGTITQSGGIVNQIFNFKNEGQGDLIINKLNTSCGCTSAAIVYQGIEGPTFTMPGHGKDNPTNWSVTIASGDSAQVKVYYDPNKHGPQKVNKESITRTISIFSNDPVEFEKQLRIDLEQTP